MTVSLQQPGSSHDNDKGRSEERYHLLADAMPQIVLTATPDGTIVYYNRRFYECTGLTPEAAISQGWQRFIHPDDLPEVVARWAASIQQQTPHEHEFRIQFRAEEPYRWHLSRILPVFDEAGRLVEWVGTCTDIDEHKQTEARLRQAHDESERRVEERMRALLDANTHLECQIEERKRAEQALHGSEIRLRAVLREMPAIVFGLTPEGIFTFSEGRGLAALGLAPGQSVGHCVYERYADHPEMLRNLRYALTGQHHAWTVEYSGIVYDTTSVPVFDAQGKLCEVIGVATGLTDRRRLEYEVIEQRTFLRKVLDATPDFVIVKNWDGQYTLVNQAFADFCGLSVEALTGQYGQAVLGDSEEIARFLRDDREVMTTLKDKFIAAESLTDAQGRVRWVQTYKRALVSPDGRARHLLCHIKDITEQKRLQAQVVQSEKLAALGELVAGVAHEINNPLAVIGGSAQLLQHHPDASVQQRGETIGRMCDRVHRIVRSLLTFARGSGDERRPAGLHDILTATLEMCEYKLRRAEVELQCHLDLETPQILVNENQMQQVLLNLLNNAEYALRGRDAAQRQIVVRTRTTTDVDGACQVLLIMADSGCGMTAEVQKRIFDPFYTTKEVGEGTGLGLSICHGIVEEHGGTLTVQSEAGVGTTFTLSLPAHLPTAQTANPETAPQEAP